MIVEKRANQRSGIEMIIFIVRLLVSTFRGKKQGWNSNGS
jgi:hypothetical protein